MRDILNLLDSVLTEENMSATQFSGKNSNVINPKTNKPYTRAELFLHKVKTGSPFTLVNGNEVVINPKEARAVAAWLASGPVKTITMQTVDGQEVKNTEIQKTVELGSKESETLKLKGSDILNTTDVEVKDFGNSIDQLLQAGGFPASEMYEKISTSPQIRALGQLGDAVIYMSYQANAGQVPKFPKDLRPAEVKAIELYASEYIGVLGLIRGSVKFKKGNRKEFDEFVGTNLGDMIMYFPKDTANPLADSFSVVNNSTGHAIKISSKAAGLGAPPAMGSLKIPEDVQKKYPEVYDFFQVATDPNLSAFTQPFEMMNWLVANADVPNNYGSLIPFNENLVAMLFESSKKNKPLPAKIMKVFNKQLSAKVQESRNTDGGKAWYAVTKDVMRAINDQGAIKDFQPAVIESLGYNFIQLYTNVKGDQLVTDAFWPAKISGQVKLKTKGSAADPTKGKISVEISAGKDTGPEIGSSAEVDTAPAKTTAQDLDTVAQQRSKVKASAGGVEKFGCEKTLGRKRQR